VLRRGSVLDTYPGLGLGNYLFFALRAHIERQQGFRTWVLDSGLNPRWGEALPLLVPLLTGPRSAAFRRLRHIPQYFHQGYGSDFTRAQLEQFISEVILSARPPQALTPDLVINVRRGDYYVDPGLRKIYAFDVPRYIRQAIPNATNGAPTGWLSVVSDDVAWCRRKLSWLADHAEIVTFGAQTPGPVGDFWEVATARTLVLGNSTFSYWAGYVSQVLHGSAHLGVWAPAFHQRNIDDGTPWQHDPRWHAVPVCLGPE